MSSVLSTESFTNSQNSQENKNNQEQLQSTAPFNLIHGDLAKFLAGDETEEFVIFERNSAPTLSSTSAADSKTAQEVPSLKAVNIILQRVEGTTVNLNLKSNQRMTPTGRKAVLLTLCIGDGSKRAEKALNLMSGPYYLDKTEQSLLPDAIWDSFSFFKNDLVLHHEDYTRFQVAKDKMCEQGRLAFNFNLGFVTSEMRAFMIEQLFTSLQELKLLNHDDIQFLKTIVAPRQTSQLEERLEKQMAEAFSKNDFKTALEMAEALHTHSRTNAKARGTNHNTSSKLIYLDDCDAAVRLGQLLEPVSPLDAITAFKIVAVYEFNEQQYEDIYESPFTVMALDKISDINISLLGSITDEATRRKFRKETVKSTFLSMSNDDPGVQANAFKTVLGLIETHAGYSSVGNVNRLFDKITVNFDGGMGGVNVFIDMMMTMADELYQLRKSANLLTAPDSKSNMASDTSNTAADSKANTAADTKSNHDRDAKISSDSGISSSALSSSSSALSSSSTRPVSGQPYTPMRSRAVRSLDDDDNDDVFAILAAVLEANQTSNPANAASRSAAASNTDATSNSDATLVSSSSHAAKP